MSAKPNKCEINALEKGKLRTIIFSKFISKKIRESQKE
jgi:hypothetical protein